MNGNSEEYFEGKVLSKEMTDKLLSKGYTEEQIRQLITEEKEKFDKEVEEKVKQYKKLDMDTFVQFIGGQNKIDRMNKVNEKLDNSTLIEGKLVDKNNSQKHTTNDLDEWKKGFMEGYDEAYKRIMSNVNKG